MLFKKNQTKKLREDAENLLRLGVKVRHYRRDILKEKQLAQLDEALAGVAELLKQKREVEPDKLNAANAKLDKIMRECGGDIYPVTFLSDNVEMLLVAAIIAIGVRSFFFQPFKIPTNSMYPTYAGMVAEVYESEADEPSALGNVWNKITRFTSSHEAYAPVSGELLVPWTELKQEDGKLFEEVYQGEPVRSTKLLVIPTTKMQFECYVGSKKVPLTLPAEFNIREQVIRKMMKPEDWRSRDYVRKGNIAYLRTHLFFEEGEKVFSFDIATGDMLFVDRFSYHFRKPEVGEPIVFRTDNIPYVDTRGRTLGETYYIKRLVGLGGDELQVVHDDSVPKDELEHVGGVLMRNGEPIEGAPAFAKNNAQEGEYNGYQATEKLATGRTFTVPEDHFMPLGDNSFNSKDGRYFGAVPMKESVGHAVFIFYPFTHRWGLAE